MPEADPSSVPPLATAPVGTTSGRSIFPKGPSFTLENFSSKDFIVKDFVESLSSSAIPVKRRSALPTQDAFDPKPFIRTFEHALGRLEALSEDLVTRETELLTGVRRAELQHSQTLESLGRKLDQSIDAFQSLDISLGQTNGNANRDSSFEAGGNVAVRIGEKLEELDQQSRRALDAKFLIQCWIELSEAGELTSLENIRRHGGGEGKVRCAALVRQLTRISQKLDASSWNQANENRRTMNGINGMNGTGHRHNTREIIEKFAETLEQDLLTQFDDFYRRQNFDGMRECANVLHDFNGGANVAALFVNQHQFFIDRSQLITEEVNSDQEIWERLGEPDADPPGVEPSLQSLIDEVKVVAEEESLIIKRAFPYYELVLSKFLQRVFQQSIQQRLEMVLEKANSVSSLAFLRSLQAARTCINALVDDLKSHGLTEHPDPASVQISLTLDQQVDELFVPYLVGNAYIEREKKSLEELYSSLLFKFTIYHSRRKKLPTTFMATLAKSGSELLASARDAYIDRLDSSDLTSSQKAMLLRVAGLKDADSAKNKNEIEVSEQDGVLSVENAKRMLRWLAESVGRDLELSGGSETPRDVLALLKLLLANMGEIYVETALEAANDFASSQETSKNEPDLSYLPRLRPAVTMMHLMVMCINTVLLPLAASNLGIRREMEKRTNAAVSGMEEKINSIMQHTVDAVLGWTNKLLQSQKKSDFRPKDAALEGGGGWLAMSQTATCLATCTFLAKVGEALSQSMDGGPNLTLCSTEIATGMRSQLLEHFKKFQVNPAGGLMVTKDITQYCSTIHALFSSSSSSSSSTTTSTSTTTSSPTISLDILLEIGNLFVIQPDALRERLRPGGPVLAMLHGTSTSTTTGESTHHKLDLLKPYLLRREDAGSVAVQSVLSGL